MPDGSVSINIRIGDYQISAGSYQHDWILQYFEKREIKNRKTGETRFGEVITETYHSTPVQVLRKITRYEYAKAEATTLQELLTVCQRIETLLEEVGAKLEKGGA